MLENYSAYSELVDSLSGLARFLIPEGEEDGKFRNNPDSRSEHQPAWHEFGIITHTFKALEHYQNISSLLSKWDIEEPVEIYLSQCVNGAPKKELLAISIALHDIGKFKRKTIRQNGGRSFSYAGHEGISENLIVNNPQVELLLDRFALNGEQVLYIARCAGLHYELGKLRKEVKSHQEYSLAFLSSDICKQMCKSVVSEHLEYKFELGILFLCDSLAKTDIDAVDNSGFMKPEKDIFSALTAKGLPLDLSKAVLQKPVNIALARQYLEMVVKNTYV